MGAEEITKARSPTIVLVPLPVSEVLGVGRVVSSA